MSIQRISFLGFSVCLLLMLSCNENANEMGQPNTAPPSASTVANDTTARTVQTSSQNDNTGSVVESEGTNSVVNTPAKVVTRARQTAVAEPSNVRLGKYGCVASKYRNGEYEFIPRGSVILKSGGNYAYQGFEEPSTGKFETDADENLLFHGGYLKDGKAEKTDREGKYLLTFPSNPDNRWTMSFAD